jgi:hypothetical protein
MNTKIAEKIRGLCSRLNGWLKRGKGAASPSTGAAVTAQKSAA